MNDTISEHKTIDIIPRSIEFSMLKMYKGEEEMQLESMLT